MREDISFELEPLMNLYTVGAKGPSFCGTEMNLPLSSLASLICTLRSLWKRVM